MLKVQLPPILETTRLILRPLHNADGSFFTELCQDADVMQYIGDGAPYSPEQANRVFGGLLQEWQKTKLGSLAVTLKSSNSVIGGVNLSWRDNLPDVEPATEIGWRFAKKHLGRGYATEAARALLDFAQNQLKLSDLISVCHMENNASVRIMLKLGFELDCQTVNPTWNCPVFVIRWREIRPVPSRLLLGWIG